jgi:CPA2 family monovalent cation:H+ antiporter-2
MEAPLDFASYKAALIVLAAAGVVIPLFHRLKVSPVLGFMLVGIVVGPFGLGTLAMSYPWLGPWLGIVTGESLENIRPRLEGLRGGNRGPIRPACGVL